MKRNVLMAFALVAAALSQTAGAITATKEYVDRKDATNAAAIAELSANVYTKAEADARIVELSPPGITTNDICAIVTNEAIVSYTDVWQLEVIDESGDIINATLDEMNWYLDDDTDPDGSGYWQLVIRYQLRGEIYDEGRPSEECVVSYDSASKGLLTELIADEKFRVWRVPGEIRNVLGLARASDLPPLSNGLAQAIASKTTTNDVCNIITNNGWFVTWMNLWDYHNFFDGGISRVSAGWGGQLEIETPHLESATLYVTNGAAWPDDKVYAGEVVEMGSGESFGYVAIERRNALGLAFASDIESGIQEESDPVWTAEKGEYAKTGSVAQVSTAVGTLWSYVYGDSVWIAVTNYMRTVGGVSPSFQLWEVRDGATNLVYWSKEEITNVTHDLIHDCKTNLEATVRNAVAEMPDKAWSKYQSATGNEAPDGVTIVSTPTIQLTGGGEWYRYVDVASNSVWFLKSNGLHTFGGDTNGYFRILDDEGNATFEVRKTDSYLVDAVASSVHFDESGNFCVSFESNIQPVIYTTASLSAPNFLPEGDDPNVTVTWTQSGGVYTATLEQAVKGPSLFAYAKIEVQGETVIRNTVPTDLQGGIILNGVKYSVGTATISGNTVLTLTPRN